MKKKFLLLIGTHNDGKFREISKLIRRKIKLISPKSLKIKAPKETGKTFRSNSELKANSFGAVNNEGYTVQILDAFPKQVDAMNVSFASQEALKLTVQMAFSRWIMK